MRSYTLCAFLLALTSAAWACPKDPTEGCPCDRAHAKQARPDSKTLYAVPIGDSPVRGDAEAEVTIIVAVDFECGFCARLSETLRRIEAAYGDQVRIVIKHNPLPFHEEAMSAAVASEAARAQGRFWEMYAMLLSGEKLGRAAYLRFAEALDLDVKAFEADLEDPALVERVLEDQRVVMSFGGRGTPSLWINGRFITGARPFAFFQGVIDEELKAAQSAIEAGTPRGRYYQTLLERAAPAL